MSVFDPLDSWFEKGFRIRQQTAARAPKREAIRARAGGGLSSTKGVQFSSSTKTRNIQSVIRKAPEVMVKITGKSSGLNSVKHHIDYISRNGEVELKNESGDCILGKAGLRDLQASYKAAQIPAESNKREFLHVIFSMPAGTPRKEMEDAVLRFCKEEFANRRYVAAFHDDTDHAHMHVCIGTRDIDRSDAPRLSPRKADLAAWRQGFAEKLRENGLDAAASERKHRFNYRKPENSVVHQIRADDPRSTVYKESRANERAAARSLRAMQSPETAFVGPLRGPRVPHVLEAQIAELRAALAAGHRPENPHAGAIEKSRASGLEGWREVKQRLEQSGQHDLAAGVGHLLAAGERVPVTRSQELFDLALAQRNKSDTQQVDREI